MVSRALGSRRNIHIGHLDDGGMLAASNRDTLYIQG